MNPQNTPEPAPQPSAPHDVRQSAHWLVCADIMDRAAVGQATYGVPLVVDNGRDHMVDGYQEMLDAVCYRRMEIEQRRQNAAPLSDDALAAECAARGWGVIRPTQGAEAPRLPGEELALDEIPRLEDLDTMATILRNEGYLVEEGPADESRNVLHSTWMDGYAIGKAEAAGVRQAATMATGMAVAFDFSQHLHAQRSWSTQTFGPGARTQGIVAHIRKELEEILAASDAVEALEEWIDVLILACDGAWRTGASIAEIIEALVRKTVVNHGRTWPDWRTLPQDQPSEHMRGNDEIPTDAALRALWERDLWPPLSMEAVATQLSHAGWIVASPYEPFPEALWRRIGEKEGYAFASSLSPAPMAPILAPEEEAPLTVLAYCLQRDLQTRGVAVEVEIRQLLGEKGIPCSARYDSYRVDLARHWPARWPDATKEVQP